MHHLLVWFPTRHGVGIRGDQMLAWHCFKALIKEKILVESLLLERLDHQDELKEAHNELAK